ncbi:MAG: long-chain acyl-CoA synthetase [Baekduia sp.]|nr:long-chain acyl-CoA synthetase [Baekduia sp.]
MEAGTTPARGTDSATIADLCTRAAELYGDQVAIKHKVGGAWRDVSFAQMGAIVDEVALGLIALGLEPGERVSILCNTRPEWTYADFAISSAGGVVVPVYPTNSPEECEWVVGNSESVFVICEDAEQVAKITAVRDRLPQLRTIIVVDPSGEVGDALALEELRRRAHGRDLQQLRDRTAAVGPDDPFTFIYTSGTTGPPKGCVLTHGNYRSVLTMTGERGSIGGEDDLVYLFLPLAHAFALLIQLAAVDVGTAIAYYGGDTKAIVGELMEVKPTYLPSVPRIFEKIYTLASQQLTPEELVTIRTVGGEIQDLEARGEPVPDALRERFGDLQPKADFVRNLFGGRIREAVTGAAPIAREILEFFWGCGIPVMEGYGMTETSTVATSSRPEAHRFGSVGRPLTGVEV